MQTSYAAFSLTFLLLYNLFWVEVEGPQRREEEVTCPNIHQVDQRRGQQCERSRALVVLVPIFIRKVFSLASVH